MEPTVPRYLSVTKALIQDIRDYEQWLLFTCDRQTEIGIMEMFLPGEKETYCAVKTIFYYA